MKSRSQRPVKAEGKRKRAFPYVLPSIKEEIRRAARANKVSQSFVVNEALRDYMGLTYMERIIDNAPRPRRSRKTSSR